jgi:hypothetical protein
MESPKDQSGKPLQVGSRVRPLRLAGKWLDDLPEDERSDVLSMVGEVFEVEEIDEYGQAWINKSWQDDDKGSLHSHSIAPDPHEIELVK